MTLFLSKLAVKLPILASNLPTLPVMAIRAKRDNSNPHNTSRNNSAYTNTFSILVATRYNAVFDDPSFSALSGML